MTLINPEEEFIGSRLIKIEYGVVSDFTETSLPYDCPFYVSLIFKKGNNTIRDVWKLLGEHPNLIPYLNKIIEKKEGDNISATYIFTDKSFITVT